MKVIVTTFITAFLISSATIEEMRPYQGMVEICDNAIDDDGDGKIDLQDEDCDCALPDPVSLIPNPSFEDQDCCPNNRSQMSCASTWIQASTPTTDYLHTCSWMGWENLPAPLPFPDGEACVGFRNGRPGFNGTAFQSDWKEYTGACLLQPLKAGETYKIQFWVGFTYAENSPPTSINFYGSPNCSDLPLDGGNNEESFGCPLRYPNWNELGKVNISGANTWNKYEITVIPYQDIEAVIIGPNCSEVYGDKDIYYFFDNLVLAEEAKFGIEISKSDSSCYANGILEVPELPNMTYQWYYEDMALLGETDRQLKGDLVEGNYRVRMISPDTCFTTINFLYRKSIKRGYESVEICNGDFFTINDMLVSDPGIYVDTLETIYGCDSIVEINLTTTSTIPDTLKAKIFTGEKLTVHNYNFDQPGHYDLLLSSSDGCDSMVYLILEEYQVYYPNIFSPDGDGYNDIFKIEVGNGVVSINSFSVFNRWGNKVFHFSDTINSNPSISWDGKSENETVFPGVYVFTAQVTFTDGKKRVLQGSVTLVL